MNKPPRTCSMCGEVVVAHYCGETVNEPTTNNTEDELRQEIVGALNPHLTAKSDNGMEWAVENIKQLLHHYATKRELEARIDEVAKAHDVALNHSTDKGTVVAMVLSGRLYDLQDKLKAQKEQENK